jgi:hypothetical protein
MGKHGGHEHPWQCSHRQGARPPGEDPEWRARRGKQAQRDRHRKVKGAESTPETAKRARSGPPPTL